jgi:hypothetical protein
MSRPRIADQSRGRGTLAESRCVHTVLFVQVELGSRLLWLSPFIYLSTTLASAS